MQTQLPEATEASNHMEPDQSRSREAVRLYMAELPDAGEARESAGAAKDCDGCRAHRRLQQDLDECRHTVDKLQVENQDLLAQVQDLKRQSNFSTRRELLQKLSNCNQLSETLQTDNRRLTAKVQDLQKTMKHQSKNTEDRLSENRSLRKEMKNLNDQVAQLQGLRGKNEVELHRLNEVVAALQKQLDGGAKREGDLKSAVKDLRHQLGDAQIIIRSKDELLNKQQRFIGSNEQTLEEYQSVIEDLKRTVRDLTEQLKRRHNLHFMSHTEDLRRTPGAPDPHTAQFLLRDSDVDTVKSLDCGAPPCGSSCVQRWQLKVLTVILMCVAAASLVVMVAENSVDWDTLDGLVISLCRPDKVPF